VKEKEGEIENERGERERDARRKLWTERQRKGDEKREK
jgi:hypothetical protein